MSPDIDMDASPRDFPDDLEIRAETAADHNAIYEVVATAFGSRAEADLVSAIRASKDFIGELSLVADLRRAVVGHVMISYAVVRDNELIRPVAVLAPLAVSPAMWRRGIGSALVRRVCQLADERGEPVVVLEGSPAFYGRLGFEYSVPHGIQIRLPDWAPPEAAQVLRLSRYNSSVRGEIVYPPSFDLVTGP
jgi:putative acetyltransferase